MADSSVPDPDVYAGENDLSKAEAVELIEDNAPDVDELLAELEKLWQAQKDELADNAEKAKAREQSTANKLLGAAAIGATGIGAMNLMEGLAEQKADDAIEQEMKAYLETFTCDYGQGRNIKGGTREVELPGATQLFAQVNEYKALAADLKARKEALGLRAGIESEVILDKAETGLYDDVGVGITSGAYTSVARALQDPTGKDAESWAKTKQDAHDKKNKGLITAGVGAIGGAAGNLIINKDAGEQSDQINSKYKKMQDELKAGHE